MKTKINLADLTDSDYKALLKNDKVAFKLMDYATESTKDSLDEWLDLLKGVRNYSLADSLNYNYMNISKPYKFLNSVLDVQKRYSLLTDTMAKRVKRVLSEYKNSEPNQFLENQLDKVSKQVANLLVKYAENEYNRVLDDPYLLEAMKYDKALEFIYGDDAYYNRENNKIYCICVD